MCDHGRGEAKTFCGVVASVLKRRAEVVPSHCGQITPDRREDCGVENVGVLEKYLPSSSKRYGGCFYCAPGGSRSLEDAGCSGVGDGHQPWRGRDVEEGALADCGRWARSEGGAELLHRRYCMGGRFDAGGGCGPD